MKMASHLMAVVFFGLVMSARVGAAVEFSDCILKGADATASEQARCATFTVPENRELTGGRTIDLNLAVLRASNVPGEPDPLFLLAGGPGQAATEAFVPLLSAFSRINQARDIVLIDQRGTGKSNRLDCPVDADDAFGDDLDKLRLWTVACRESLAADVSQYTTLAAIADLDAVRKAMGYEKINLLGISYGTRVATAYMRYYPEHTRSVVLDGVVPPEEALGESHAKNLDQALAALFAACASDEDCARHFPDPAADMRTIFSRLESSPAAVSTPHPRTGEMQSIQFTRDDFAAVIRLFSYASESAALLPLMLRGAADTERYGELAAQGMLIAADLGDSLAKGMELSVMCSEDVPFFDQNQQISDASVMGNMLVELASVQCEAWPRAKIPPDYKDQLQSDIPTLLISGELDPVTPPAFAEQTKAGLTHSLHIEVRGQGHSVTAKGCMPRIIRKFIESGSVKDLETECLDPLGPFPFFVNFMGPMP